MLESKRLIFRSPEIGDAENIYRNIVSEDVYYYLPYAIPLSIKEVSDGVLKWKDHENDSYRWYIQERKGGLIGEIHYIPLPKDPLKVEFGGSIGKLFQNKGYMSEALDTTGEYLKKQGITSIIIETDSENVAMQITAEKNGFDFLYDYERVSLALKVNRRIYRYEKRI